jgi:hypothetical protein
VVLPQRYVDALDVYCADTSMEEWTILELDVALARWPAFCLAIYLLGSVFFERPIFLSFHFFFPPLIPVYV